MSGTVATPEAGMAMVEDAFLTLRAAGLRLPPIPRELVDGLTHPADAVWQSGDVAAGDLDGFLAAAGDQAAPAQLAFGHLGHGIGSWHFVYQLVTPALALFLRLPYGGIDSSDPASLGVVNDALTRAEELVVAAEAVPGGGRTLVIFDMLGDTLLRLPGDAAPAEADDPIGAALARLRPG